MGRDRTGSLTYKDGEPFVRVQYKDHFGKRRSTIRKVSDIRKWKKELEALQDEIKLKLAQAPTFDTMKFAHLADYFRDTYIKDPKYVELPGGEVVKVEGYRSKKTVEGYFKHIRAHFDGMKLAAITYEDLRDFKMKLLSTKTFRGDDRSISDVHRHLSLLRRILRVAERKKWIASSPFRDGEPLINLSIEQHRQRILTKDEEEKMIAACTGQREHLKPILVCMLDLAARQGELFKLVWADVDLAAGMINIRGFTTKTLKSRQVAMTTRVREELTKLWEASDKKPESSVFGIKNNVRKSWAKALVAAGIKDKVRRHDARHTAATRLTAAGVKMTTGARILGHSQLSTYFRYNNPDGEILQNAAAALEKYNRQSANANGEGA